MKRNCVINAAKLLVQYKLMKNGIYSLPIAQGKNVDLEVYSINGEKLFTIQIKTTEKPRPGGGNGKDALSWNLSKTKSASFIACVDLSSDSVWIFTPDEIITQAQHPSKDKIYMYTDESVNTRGFALKSQFKDYLIENKVKTLKSSKRIK